MHVNNTQLLDHVDYQQPLHVDNRAMQLRPSQETRNPLGTTVQTPICVYSKIARIPLALVKTFLTTHGNHQCVNRRVRTDGEGSLTESLSCRFLLNTLGYTMEKTATDSSSQNGIAERPRQTYAAMV